MKERRVALCDLLGGIIPARGSIVWEIGCGHGHFLSAYARAHPEELCIGIDIASERIGRAERKRERAQLRNLHFVRADAEDFLASFPEGASFERIFILFPDPWPKRRHHKNRVVNTSFLSGVARGARKGAGLYFRTDHEPYFHEVEEALRAHPDWLMPEAPAWPFEEPTVFEKRAKRHFSLEARRR